MRPLRDSGYYIRTCFNSRLYHLLHVVFILTYAVVVSVGQTMEELGRGKKIGVLDIIEAVLIILVLGEYFISIGVRGKEAVSEWIIVD